VSVDKRKGLTHAATHQRTLDRQALLLSLVGSGLSVKAALSDPRIGVSEEAYRKWRQNYPLFGAELDIIRATRDKTVPKNRRDLTSAQFAFRYFQRERTHFQQEWINRVEALRPGNILLALWPPQYGKTTTFVDYATEKICRNPSWRNTTASESDAISKKVIGQVRQRLEPFGPYPQLVKDWGPFRPQTGQAASARAFQPWNNTHFNVVQKQAEDEKDHSMLAIGWTSSTVSIRTDHLHLDDLQGTKTVGRTDQLLQWFRQDALSRPGEDGITTIAGTRVDSGDFYEALLEDDELDGILEVVRFPAIRFDEKGEPYPLWPELHTLEQLERIRRKIKDDAFDRNYMMAPGQSRTRRTFSEEGRALALQTDRVLHAFRPVEVKPPVILSLDPALGRGICTLAGMAPTEETLDLVYFDERTDLLRNEDIVQMLSQACATLTPFYRVLVLVVEANNFQKGLARDERLIAVKNKYGFLMKEHVTSSNKYDSDIGVASMAGDWEAGKIRLPYANEPNTRTVIDEVLRQLRTWRPNVSGKTLRQDRVMCMWFAWIWWTEHRHRLNRKPTSWHRAGLPYAPMVGRPQPIVPIRTRVN
jgi:hypothetical protein